MTSKLISMLMVFTLIISIVPTFVLTGKAESDPITIVSLGDSYSSGEGIEPFYGQDKPLFEKVKDKDWIAHRSTKSWPSLLKISDGITTGNYRVTDNTNRSSICQWYFAAASGAKTKDLKNEQGKDGDIKIRKFYPNPIVTSSLNLYAEDNVKLPPQLSIFDSISNNVDYVTLTLGGNDVGFADIIFTCAINCAYLHFGKTTKLEEQMNDVWRSFDKIKSKLKKAYKDIDEAAKGKANIIVAGYPKLLDKNGAGTVINKKEAKLVNKNVSKFNKEIEKIVNECRSSNMNIHFVDVETEFDKDGGHQAYSKNAWIKKIHVGAKAQDINDLKPASAYSIHPNEEGAKAYARCVNAKIAEIERSKNVGTLSGKICKASDRATPVTDATIEIVNDNVSKRIVPDNNGNYSITLPIGDYHVKVSANGYIDFNAYATVEKDQTSYMETFLMVEGVEGEIGTAVGTINNALTGTGLKGVTLDVRNGWNNTNNGSILTTISTNSSGKYTVTLPIGNYTLYATKNGFVSTAINIVVQKGACLEKNGAMTPIISGNSFRIVLTWGANPSDLDSHVVSKLNSGNNFHVYFGNKSAYNGSTEICNLDVDDTTSYGPETITLNTSTDGSYYYYIHRYAGTGSVGSSSAQINVYQGENVVATFNVPTNQGNSDYWNVFSIKDGVLIVKNTITSSPDLTY